jgi:hypothetical protein
MFATLLQSASDADGLLSSPGGPDCAIAGGVPSLALGSGAAGAIFAITIAISAVALIFGVRYSAAR